MFHITNAKYVFMYFNLIDHKLEENKTLSVISIFIVIIIAIVMKKV